MDAQKIKDAECCLLSYSALLELLRECHAENVRLRELLAKWIVPQDMSGWDDPNCDESVAADIREACELTWTPLPEWMR